MQVRMRTYVPTGLALVRASCFNSINVFMTTLSATQASSEIWTVHKENAGVLRIALQAKNLEVALIYPDNLLASYMSRNPPGTIYNSVRQMEATLIWFADGLLFIFPQKPGAVAKVRATVKLERRPRLWPNRSATFWIDTQKEDRFWRCVLQILRTIQRTCMYYINNDTSQPCTERTKFTWRPRCINNSFVWC